MLLAVFISDTTQKLRADNTKLSAAMARRHLAYAVERRTMAFWKRNESDFYEKQQKAITIAERPCIVA